MEAYIIGICAVKAALSTIGLLDLIIAMNICKITSHKAILHIFTVGWIILSVLMVDTVHEKTFIMIGIIYAIINATYISTLAINNHKRKDHIHEKP